MVANTGIFAAEASHDMVANRLKEDYLQFNLSFNTNRNDTAKISQQHGHFTMLRSAFVRELLLKDDTKRSL